MLPLPDTVAPCPYSVFVNTCGAHIMLGILILLYMCSLFQPLYTFTQTPLRVTYSGQTRRSSESILTNESTIRLTHIAQLQGAYFLTHGMQLCVYRFIFPSRISRAVKQWPPFGSISQQNLLASMFAWQIIPGFLYGHHRDEWTLSVH